MFASHHKLDNLIAIVDYNKIQSAERVENIINLEPLVEKWKAFGWNVSEVDGHDFLELSNVFNSVSNKNKKPSVIIAHTLKGKGLSFLEDNPNCHYYRLTENEEEIALEEII